MCELQKMSWMYLPCRSFVLNTITVPELCTHPLLRPSNRLPLMLARRFLTTRVAPLPRSLLLLSPPPTPQIRLFSPSPLSSQPRPPAPKRGVPKGGGSGTNHFNSKKPLNRSGPDSQRGNNPHFTRPSSFPTSSSNPHPPKPGDWKCRCGVNNFASRVTCFKCGQNPGQNMKSPAPAAAPGESAGFSIEGERPDLKVSSRPTKPLSAANIPKRLTRNQKARQQLK